MPTIALVDDDRNILTSVSIALEAEGHRINTYPDGLSALDQAEGGQRAIEPPLDGVGVVVEVERVAEVHCRTSASFSEWWGGNQNANYKLCRGKPKPNKRPY